MAPRRGRGHALLVTADFLKEFLDLCLTGSVDIDDHLTDLFLTTTLIASAIIVVAVLMKHTSRLQKKYAKILFYLNS
ncbi:MAG: hypothetical protein PVH37_04950 [Desulfobacterales bacterium]|jgi:hypothetical protein